MKKKYYLLYLITFFTFTISAQDYSTLWEGHYSFYNIQDVSQGNNKVYVASENAIFIYDTIDQGLQEITTVEGLSGEYISTIHYSEIYELVLIGYENGLIEVYKEQEGDIITVVDIINKQNIPPDSKRINHFNERNDIVYISTDYGISVYNLERLEFGDTFYIGFGGLQTKISQTTILDGWIYAASKDTNSTGIKRAPIDSQNLIDFNEWEQFRNGNQFSSIQAVGDQLFVTRAKRIFRATPGGYSQLNLYSDIILDVKEFNENLIVTTKSEVIIYDLFFNTLASFGVIQPFETDFTSAILTDEGVYIGTEDFGVLRTTIEDSNSYQEIYPDGPLRNNPFAINIGNGELWVSYGDYTDEFNPSPRRKYGLSYLKNEEWNNIKYDSILNTLGQNVENLNTITINPFNSNQVYVSSFQNGLLELNEGEPTILYNESNSGLESLLLPSNPSYKSIRTSGTIFDKNGILWSITSLIDKPLKSYNPNTGQWNSYSFSEIITDPIYDENGFKEIDIGVNETIWICSYSNGLIGFNKMDGQIKNVYDFGTFNLRGIKAIAVDNRNHLWIGTITGLRVLYNTNNFFEEPNVSVEPIIFLEDGIPKELLEQQYISDIKVDGSNNKWIGTIGAGVFYFTSDGQETIYHFTKDNSPLPSNNINDISIDNVNGEVYIATERGLLSFGSGGSKPQESLSEAYVYPNPVRPDFDMFDKKIKIKDISENCNIKITDIEGNLVAEAQSRTNLRYNGFNLEIDGGTAYWNGKNLANNNVATGVYLVMLSDLDSFETRILKLMVIR